MSPSSENKNPVVDELSGNFQVPYIVQENEVPAIDTNGQSFSQACQLLHFIYYFPSFMSLINIYMSI